FACEMLILKKELRPSLSAFRIWKPAMPKLVPIKPKKLIKILLVLGFKKRDAEGAHEFFANSDGRTTVISIHNREMSKGLLRKVLNDIRLSVEEYDKLRG
ncbi:MAG: type II toxin-antitoxin system HicA family toxin, partial [Candidatus Vogelbacteria bacterium]|nr:type II toxin-antitoxin system HicA family toxin [Candidatus Vogelbacteria bacterium]